VLEGDDRLTSAFALRLEVKEGLWMVEAEDLNGLLPSIGGAALFGRMAGGIPKKAEKDDDDEGGGSGNGGGALPADIPTVGIAACDDYVKHMWKCGDKQGGPGGQAMKDGAKQSAEAWKKAAVHPSARSVIEEGCKKTREAMKTVCP
jgi:hypothetical protein